MLPTIRVSDRAGNMLLNVENRYFMYSQFSTGNGCVPLTPECSLCLFLCSASFLLSPLASVLSLLCSALCLTRWVHPRVALLHWLPPPSLS